VTTIDAVTQKSYEDALQAFYAGQYGQTIELLSHLVQRHPNWASAWLVLGDAYWRKGHAIQAQQAMQRAVELDPDEETGARVWLARARGEVGLPPLPSAYVRNLFDQYACHFEEHLIGELSYRAPRIMREALLAEFPQRRFRQVIDLGCGTGLSGQLFIDLCDALTGIDLSANMLKKAEEKNIYRQLIQGEIATVLMALPAADADLIIAADVLVYLGDLTACFVAAQRVLAWNGLFLFTIEESCATDEPYQLGEHMRYTHRLDYITSLSKAQGWSLEFTQACSTRNDKQQAVFNQVICLRKVSA
jgi:predicted TPR repeat methyltransferase